MTPAEIAQKADEDLRAVLSTESGRRFLWRVVEGFSGAVAASYDGQALGTVYNEGRRSVGLRLVQECQRVDLPGFMRAYAEAMETAKNAARAAEMEREAAGEE